MNCWALKRHIENLFQHGYLDEFVLDPEEGLEAGDTPDEAIN